MIRTARGPGHCTFQLGHEPQPPQLARGRGLRPGINPGCKTATCGMRAAHSNQIKPLNLVDQSQEAGAVVLAVRGVRWVTFGGQPLHSERVARTVVTWPALRTGGSTPDCHGNHPGRNQTRTRRAFGMERSMTCSRSPTYSPST